MAEEPIEVFKTLAPANRWLAKLKGRVVAIPNPGILVDTLALQEAKASSEIEDIVTTPDELFQANLFSEGLESPAAQEVASYRDALKFGFDKLRQTDGLITNATIVGMFQLFKRRIDGFRRRQAQRSETIGQNLNSLETDRSRQQTIPSEIHRRISGWRTLHCGCHVRRYPG